jgi:hypothetical protein
LPDSPAVHGRDTQQGETFGRGGSDSDRAGGKNRAARRAVVQQQEQGPTTAITIRYAAVAVRIMSTPQGLAALVVSISPRAAPKKQGGL